jgi:hypothetical protein
MRAILLGIAAVAGAAGSSAPAAAERWSDAGFAAAANVSVHRAEPMAQNYRRGQWRNGDRRREARGRDRGPIFVGGDYPYVEDNPAWQPDGFNDWWHERPNRSSPRWVQNNGRCERMWWAGDGWRC